MVLPSALMIPLALFGPMTGMGQGFDNMNLFPDLEKKLYEWLLPDIRFEWSSDDHGLIVSRPITVSLPPYLWTRDDDTWESLRGHWTDDVYLQFFLEPQYQVRGGDWRGLLGSRALYDFDGFGAHVEGGGLVGTDGHGGMAGGGVFYGDPGGIGVHLTYRSTWAGGHRNSLGVSLEVPWTVW